jgi:RelB Antitoxin
MEVIKRKYVVNEKNRKIAVQLDIKTFNRIEKIMENFALYKLMDENKDEETLDINSAKKFYSKLEKLN